MVENNSQFYFNPDYFKNLKHFLLLREELDVRLEKKEDKFFQYNTEEIILREGAESAFLYSFSLPTKLEKSFIEKYKDLKYSKIFEVTNLYENRIHFRIKKKSPFMLDHKKLIDFKIVQAIPIEEEFLNLEKQLLLTSSLKNQLLNPSSDMIFLEEFSIFKYLFLFMLPIKMDNLINQVKRDISDSQFSCLRIIRDIKSNEKHVFGIFEPEKAAFEPFIIKNNEIIYSTIAHYEIKLPNIQDTE